MGDCFTYPEVRSASSAAAELRSLARRVAQRLPSTVAATGDGLYGWSLWEKTGFYNGEAHPKDRYTTFSWWQSSAELWLCSDGRLVFLEKPVPQEGTFLNRTRPINYTLTDSPREASDEELFYPDAFKWRTHEHVERAPARHIIERHSVPELFRRDLGRGVADALRQLDRDGPSPTLIVPRPASQPSPQAQSPTFATGASSGTALAGSGISYTARKAAAVIVAFGLAMAAGASIPKHGDVKANQLATTLSCWAWRVVVEPSGG